MDKRAKSILFKTHWGSTGWKSEFTTSPEDFAYAKSKGLMFDPVAFSHDEAVRDALATRANIPTDKPARAFLSSLSTRRLDWRSGFGSWSRAGHLEPHTYEALEIGQSYGPDGAVTHRQFACAACEGRETYRDVDLNVFNFERLKWGGVRHGSLDYVWFDLAQLQREEIPEPTADDVAILRAILDRIAASAPGDYPGTLEKNLASALKSSKDERRQLIEILACAGILKPGSTGRPVRGKSDWHFAEFWRGEDGYDRDAVRAYFGSWLKEVRATE